MDFGLSEEQRLLQETVRRYLEANLTIVRVREIVAARGEGARPAWRALAELGVAGVLVPEARGGAGLSLLDAALVQEILGWGAAPLPFLSTAVLAPVALDGVDGGERAGGWLSRVSSGELLLGAAIHGVGGADLRSEGGRVSGVAPCVLDAGGADLWLVVTAAGTVALVSPDAAGLVVEPLSPVDATRGLAAAEFRQVEPEAWIGDGSGDPTLADRVADAGRAVLAADILGACDRAISMAVDYAQQRRQFGRVIGSFQAVKHMCSEMVAAVEPARSLVWFAAYAFDSRPEEREVAIALAKSHLADIGADIVRTSTEVHGGLGFTDEHPLHLWFKRVELDRQLLGGPARLRERAARLQGWSAALP